MASYARRYRAEWQSLVSEFETAGQSVKSFYIDKSIGQASFYLWRKRLAGPSPVAPSHDLPFIDVSALSVDAVSAEPSWSVELALGDGLVLRLNRR